MKNYRIPPLSSETRYGSRTSFRHLYSHQTCCPNQRIDHQSPLWSPVFYSLLSWALCKIASLAPRQNGFSDLGAIFRSIQQEFPYSIPMKILNATYRQITLVREKKMKKELALIAVFSVICSFSLVAHEVTLRVTSTNLGSSPLTSISIFRTCRLQPILPSATLIGQSCQIQNLLLLFLVMTSSLGSLIPVILNT